ncbi:hypothetical protein D3C71_1895950 [compost metagenome]
MQEMRLRQFNLMKQLSLQLYVVQHLILLRTQAVLLRLKRLLMFKMLASLSLFLKRL